MSAFARTVAQASPKRPAPRVVTLLPHHFADTWDNRPVAGIQVGLRDPAEFDKQVAQIEAARVASAQENADTDERIKVYNDTVLSIVVARAFCSPNDVTAEHPFFEMAEDMVPAAFTTKTIQWLYDEIEKLAIEQSPCAPEATDDEILAVIEMLSSDEALAAASPINQARIRRYLGFVHELLLA